jgi:hypothetical protein
MAIGLINPAGMISTSQGSDSIANVLSSVASAPMGGSETFNIDIGNGLYAPLKMNWGLGLGGWLLLIAGIIVIIAGIIEISAKTIFFQTKVSIPTKGAPVTAHPPVMPKTPTQTPAPTPPKKETKKKDKSKSVFCGECGTKLDDNATFCSECGKKV